MLTGFDIRLTRIRKHISLRKLAKLVFSNTATLRKIETQQAKRPNPELLKRIENILNNPVTIVIEIIAQLTILTFIILN